MRPDFGAGQVPSAGTDPAQTVTHLGAPAASGATGGTASATPVTYPPAPSARAAKRASPCARTTAP